MGVSSVAVRESARIEASRSADGLAQLYTELGPAIRRLCISYLHNAEDAEDLTQEAFLRLAARLDGLNGDPAAYAFRIARNLACNELARRRRHDKATTRIGCDDDVATTALARSECRDLLRRVRQSLTDDEMTLFARLAEGLSQAEAADVLGITEKNVSVRLCRARKRVRALFGAASAVASWAFWVRLRRAARPAAGRAPAALAPGAVLSAAMVGIVSFGALSLQPWNARNVPAPASVNGSAHLALPGASAAGPATATQTGIATAATPGAPAVRPAGPVTAGGLTHSLISPGDGARPEDTSFGSIAVSPAYQQDHTILAAGVLANGCSNPLLCDVLFRSSDGGRTWEHLAGSGFAGGTLLLPPAYPASHVVFAMGQLGLQESTDGGASFTLVVPGRAPAAVSPASTGPDTRILLGTNPLTIYDASTRRVTPGPALPTRTLTVDSVAYAGTSGLLFVSAEAANPVGTATGSYAGEIIRCAAGLTCQVVATAPGTSGLQLVTSPNFDRDGTADAVAGTTLLASHDGGSIFSRVVAPASSTWRAVVATGAGVGARTLVAVAQSATGSTATRMFVSPDDGASFSEGTERGVSDEVVFAVLASLPDGHLLAGLQPGPTSSLFGLRCSADGMEWTPGC